MKTLKFEIPQEAVNVLEALDYEIKARRNLIMTALSNNMDTETDAFARYQKELVGYELQYDHAKARFEQETVKKLAEGQNVMKWHLDFTARTLTVTCDD